VRVSPPTSKAEAEAKTAAEKAAAEKAAAEKAAADAQVVILANIRQSVCVCVYNKSTVSFREMETI
jgi:hypothetical protein